MHEPLKDTCSEDSVSPAARYPPTSIRLDEGERVKLVWVNEFVRLDSTPAKCTASQRSKVDASMRGSRQLWPEAAASELGGDSGVAEGEAEVG